MFIFFLIIAILIITAVIIYNSLIAKKNNVQKAFGNIDVLLKRRYDMIPNLVETVKEYMGYEKQVLTDVTALRSRAISDGVSDDERVKIENDLSMGLGRIKVAVENYPGLKASQNFIQLQATWTTLEEEISAGRSHYNAVVTTYNNAVEMFPSNIMAGLMGYVTKPLFETPSAERDNISARELFKN